MYLLEQMWLNRRLKSVTSQIAIDKNKTLPFTGPFKVKFLKKKEEKFVLI